MKIIISPAKKMKENTDILPAKSLPALLDYTEELLSFLKVRRRSELQKIWKCNDQITDQNVERLRQMELRHSLTPAIFAYEGLQYQYIASDIMDKSQLRYLEEHLRILSGFYGVLKPFDGVTGYRLEMQSKLSGFTQESLYDYWGDAIYHEVLKGCKDEQKESVLNLASKEYSRCIEKYAKCPVISCIFAEKINGKIVEKGTLAKMARGEMVRFLAENKIRDVKKVKDFDRLGYTYSKEDSRKGTLVFIKSDPTADVQL